MHNLQTRRKKFKRAASGCKSRFCQSKNQKYLQILLLPKFPIMSEKCITYRTLKHQKSIKTIKRGLNKLSVDAKMHSLCYFMITPYIYIYIYIYKYIYIYIYMYIVIYMLCYVIFYICICCVQLRLPVILFIRILFDMLNVRY